MKKAIPLIVILALILLIGFVIFWMMAKEDSIPSPDTTELGTSLVEINSFGFIPQTITIKKGDSIKWVNKDSQPHQVVIDFGASRIEGKILEENEEYSLRFMEQRDYDYYCGIHPSMTGKIIVQD